MDALIQWVLEWLGLSEQADSADKSLGFPDPNG